MPQAENEDRSPPISELSNLAILVNARRPPDPITQAMVGYARKLLVLTPDTFAVGAS
jgi:hypothetical protein